MSLSTTPTQESCIVCHENDWLAISTPDYKRSVRSDGAVLNQPLLKAQCAKCGLVQTLRVPDSDTLAILYTDSYDIYNNRPASEQFVAGRYSALAKAITSVVTDTPKEVLEVGCGNGAALEAVQSIWKEANCIGVEPVTTAVKAAQSQGLNVHQGMIGVDVPADIANKKFDVIYSVHVIEHTQNPVLFLQELKKMLAPNGRLIISCPNARVPNLEMMRTDHNFSMTPYHLEMLTRQAQLVPLQNTNCPGGAENLDYEHNQLLVSRLPNENETIELSQPIPDYLSDTNRTQLYAARKKYFADFERLDEILHQDLDDVTKLYCFGSGGWACMLAGYAPKIWEKIVACVVDGGSDETFHGKPILSYNELKAISPGKILVGTNPATQPFIAKRLEADGFIPVRWDHIIAV